MADNVEAILLRLGLDASGFTKGTRQARQELGLMEKGVGSLKGEIAALAATAAAGIGFAVLIHEALAFAESVTKVHDQTGLAVESIQYLRLAADLTGTSIDSLAGLVSKMQRQLVEAGTNDKLHAQLAAIGVNVEQLRNLRPEEQLQAIANAIGQIQDPAEQAAAAVVAFGKSGAEALPQIKALASQQEELQAAFTRTGGAVSGDTIAAVEGLGDSFAELKTAVVAMATELVGAAAPALRSFLEVTTEVVAGLRLLDGEGSNALVNLDNKIDNLQGRIDSFKKSNPFPDDWGKQQLATMEAQLKVLREQEQVMLGVGEAGAKAFAADRLAKQLALEKALSDGTLAEVQVRVQHVKDGQFATELAEQQHQERRAAIIANANATLLEQDLAFRQQMSEHAMAGSIEVQDVVHGGLSAIEQFQADSWQNQVQTVAGSLSQMTAGIAQHSKAAFEVNKAASIVNTVVQTIQAVTKAWADYGWPYGAVVGAAIAAAGIAQVQAIKNTSFNGGGGGVPPSGATTPPVNTATQGGGGQGNGQTLRVEGLSADSIVTGASARALAEKLLEFQKDGGQVVFQS